MGYKTDNLNKLVSSKINVHEYKEIFSIEELLNYSNQNDKFSIRFDKRTITHNLPFYVYDKKDKKDKQTFFSSIIKQMKEMNCTLLCSNGYKDDEYLKFNFVIEIDDKYNFILEICSKKVPLREMYQYKTSIIKGNLFEDNKYNYINKDDNDYQKEDINEIIDWMINKKYKYVEGTLYTKKVGILNEKIIIWQTL